MDRTSEMDFTDNAWEALYDAVDNTYFRDQDADLILHTLEKHLRFIPFGEYLRRYIYRKAELTESFWDVSVKDYQQIIKGSFADHHTPQSFSETTARLSGLSKNWLTQQTVKRNVVFLLGFGLGMSADDVHLFLTKALREQGINAKNPFEVICWYCYKNGYSYPKFESLWQTYQNTPVGMADQSLLYKEETVGIRTVMYMIQNETELMAFLSKLKTSNNQPKMSVTARRWFRILYDQARDHIAMLYNHTETEKSERNVLEYQQKLSGNARLYDFEKQKLLKKKKETRRLYHREDITESDMEHVICSAIPLDRHGNLTPGKASKLNEQFAGKRFSRQHIHDVLTGKSEINRFDLITLNFFVFSQMPEYEGHSKKRYVAFIDSMNRILEECYLGPLYIANPYECFVLMCILSEDPLGTYADVWELSYDGGN